ncbi:MAG: M13 family metallopeptidase [Opitutaceae bacterium]|jgi:predicted metalloendopeptidase|nr:M13 family metallopeptidase [Opitutaceae bacterium]
MRTHILRALPLLAASLVLAPVSTLRAELDLKAIDSSVRPQDDFFDYANGTWLKTLEIPADQLGWGSFYELIDRTQKNLRQLCEDASAKQSAAPGSPERMVGDFYASGMDEAAINAAGVRPIQPQLDRIAAIKTPADVIAAIAALKQIGVHTSFGFYVDVDEKDSEAYLVQITQGGLGLPDRDYYFTDSEKMKKLRGDYTDHVAKMLTLAGEDSEAARIDAQAVMNLETKLAAASRTRVQLRDPEANYNKTAVADLAKLTGDFDWAAFFKAMGARGFDSVNVGQPDFVKAFAAQIAGTPVADWRAYLRWNLVRTAAPCLSADFVNENFAFYGQTLNGQKEIKPRWKRVTETIDGSIGDALGQLYVAKYFPPAAKARVLRLVEDLRSALRERIETLEWMDAPTRARALEKLNAFSVKMGYPDKWRDYPALTISRGASFVENVFASDAHETRRNLAKIGKPVDRTEWFMTPPTINAYYNPVENGIVFPAGILQPPFFDADADDAVNYGGIGTVIGHEMTHGFDDQGRQYDARGNLKDWWTPGSTAAFKKRAAVIIEQFNGYTVLDGTLHVNGALTQGENIADLGGVKIAHAALQRALAGQSRAKIDGLTPEQRFFLSYASIWREVRRPEYRRNLIITDPHSPAEWRVRGPLSNLEEFWKAFDVKEGDRMRRSGDQIVTIW